jgi:hypothetical protein
MYLVILQCSTPADKARGGRCSFLRCLRFKSGMERHT